MNLDFLFPKTPEKGGDSSQKPVVFGGSRHEKGGLFGVSGEGKWDLDSQILCLKPSLDLFGEKETSGLTLSDCLRGVQVFGSTGSGKSTGSGQALARSFLREGYGGLVLCVKSDEADTWREYAKKEGREKDLVVVRPGDPSGNFNFLSEEARSSKGLTINTVQMLLDIHALYTRGTSGGSGQEQDAFWQNQLHTLLTHSIVVAKAFHKTLSVRGLIQVIRDATQHSEHVQDPALLKLLKNRFDEALSVAESEWGQKPGLSEFKDAKLFFEGEFRTLAEKTRSIIVAMALSVLEPLTREPLQGLFCTTTGIRPEDSFQGKVIVVDVPVHSYRRAGLLSQLIWKLAFRNAVKSRVEPDRPVFLWADESQYFVEASDVEFLTTSRSQRCITVYLTQNLSNYQAVLGSEAKVSAILGSLNLRIFHQNNDPKTNDFASQTIGKVKVKNQSTSVQGKASFFKPKPKQSVTTSETWDFDVPARVFSALKAGGLSNRLEVEAIVHATGRKLSGQKPWIRASFRQG